MRGGEEMEGGEWRDRERKREKENKVYAVYAMQCFSCL
jgi:hypothetical protein